MVRDGNALHSGAGQARFNICWRTIGSSILFDVDYQKSRQIAETSLMSRFPSTTRFAIVILDMGHSQRIRDGALDVRIRLHSQDALPLRFLGGARTTLAEALPHQLERCQAAEQSTLAICGRARAVHGPCDVETHLEYMARIALRTDR